MQSNLLEATILVVMQGGDRLKDIIIQVFDGLQKVAYVRFDSIPKLEDRWSKSPIHGVMLAVRTQARYYLDVRGGLITFLRLQRRGLLERGV